MKKRNLMKAICLILIIYTALVPVSVLAGGTIPLAEEQGGVETDLCDLASDSDSREATASEVVRVDNVCPTLSDGVEVGSRFFELFFGEKKKEAEPITLLPGGEVFGMRIQQKHVTVTDSKGVPALKSGDTILSIDGKEVKRACDVRRLVQQSEGKSLTIKAIHGGNEIAIEVRPVLDGGEYRLGLSLRDAAAGLGTVTFIDPKSGRFGGLGHGIVDAESGEIIEMERGDVCGVVLGGIHKGECGKPGEICGVLTNRDLGDIFSNGECGVFGVIDNPQGKEISPLEIGRREEIREGEATIISTLKNGRTAEYKIEIYDIDRESKGSKSFRIRVTDETLKTLTGGIIRGMSGSPIIQDGKLIGAVTHVLVADPTEGYGIFIENMLDACGISEQQKAA